MAEAKESQLEIELPKDTEPLPDIAALEYQMAHTTVLGDHDPELRKALESQDLTESTDHAPSGGLRFTNAKILEFQRKVMWEFVKDIGFNLASGSVANVVSISLPVKIFEPRSLLQRLADAWYTAPALLTPAGQSDDPIFRFKSVLVFAVSGLRNMVKQWKPFNPILGETYQAKFHDGSQICLEQTFHHPPISHWQVFGVEDCYHFFGYGRWDAGLRGNGMKGSTIGPNIVAFKDGSKISFSLPYLWLSGVLWGDRVAEYLGELKIRDKKNGLECTLVFNPDAVGFIQSFFVSAASPSDRFKGDILQNGKKICAVSGSWLTAIDFDKKEFFKFESDKYEAPTPVDHPLPSDSRFRDDLKSLSKGDYDDAQKKKVVLEEIQRRDRKLRARFNPTDGEDSTH